MRTMRLSELVEQGRLVLAGAKVGAMSPEVPPAPLAQYRPRARDDIVDKIELLAVQLLSISKSRKADSEALLREALLSIEECIVAIGSKH